MFVTVVMVLAFVVSVCSLVVGTVFWLLKYRGAGALLLPGFYIAVLLALFLLHFQGVFNTVLTLFLALYSVATGVSLLHTLWITRQKPVLKELRALWSRP